jgi:hypothetical protein
VKLQGLTITATASADLIAEDPSCVAQATGSANTTGNPADWASGADLATDTEVVCTFAYTFTQTALEAILASTNTPGVCIEVNAQATAGLDAQPVSTGMPLEVAVSQHASLAVTILDDQCQVPQEPGASHSFVSVCVCGGGSSSAGFAPRAWWIKLIVLLLPSGNLCS